MAHRFARPKKGREPEESTAVSRQAGGGSRLPPGSPPNGSHAGAAPGGDDLSWYRAALDRWVERVAAMPEGGDSEYKGRNDCLNRAWTYAGSLGHAIARETAREALWAAAERSGLDSSEIGSVLRDGDGSGWEVGAQTPRYAPESHAPDVTIIETDDFWNSHPILTGIHDAAKNRIVSPWAVLGSVLARVCAATPFTVQLPAIVGGKAPLNLYVALVGPSGSGKGAAYSVAVEHVHTGYVRTVTPGSGEGIAHIFKHRTRTGEQWIDDSHAALAFYDEIDQLIGQAGRRGSTVLPLLRTAWTGGTLGTVTADRSRALTVPAGEYRLAMVAGVQPGRADGLLADADGGLPQRMLWLPATDSEAERGLMPPWPGTHLWQLPPMSEVRSLGGNEIAVCEAARDHIIETRYANTRGEVDALDGHAQLCRLKTAALLAILFGHWKVGDEEWRLAGIIQRKSDHTRELIRSTLAVTAAKKREALARSEVELEDVKYREAEERRRAWVMRKLRGKGSMSENELRMLASRDTRAELEGVLTRLEADGEVAITGENKTGHPVYEARSK